MNLLRLLTRWRRRRESATFASTSDDADVNCRFFTSKDGSGRTTGRRDASECDSYSPVLGYMRHATTQLHDTAFMANNGITYRTHTPLNNMNNNNNNNNNNNSNNNNNLSVSNNNLSHHAEYGNHLTPNRPLPQCSNDACHQTRQLHRCNSSFRQSRSSRLHSLYSRTPINTPFTRWAAETTMHGPAHALQSTSNAGALFWYLLVCASCACLIPQLYMLIYQYIDPGSNWSTSVYEESPERGLALPTLLMCNFNRIKRSRALALGFDEDHIVEYFEGDNLYLWERSRVDYARHAANLSEFLRTRNMNMRDALDNMSLTCEDYIVMLKSNLKLTNRSHMFNAKNHPLTEKFGVETARKLCGARFDMGDDFQLTYAYTSDLGRCVRLDFNNHTVRVKRPGPNGGISLILDVRPKEYLHHLVNNYMDNGFSLGFSYGESIEWITVSAGYHVWVGLQKERRQVKNTGLSSFWTPPGCTMEPNMTVIDQSQYSPEMCAFDCHMREFARQCGCVATIIPIANYQMCDYDNECSLKLTDTIKLDPYAETTNPDVAACKDQCLPLCNSNSINVAISMNRFLTDHQAQRLMEHFEPGRFNSTADVLNSFVTIDVYFRTLSEKVIEKKLTITVDQLISQIGGQLGLWLGVSMLSLVHAISCVIGAVRAKIYTLIVNSKVQRS